MLKNPEIIKYRVMGAFGGLDEGEVINAILIQMGCDENAGLIYHPKVRGECSSMEFAEEKDDGIWEKINEIYINIEDKGVLQRQLFGKRFTWKREFFTVRKVKSRVKKKRTRKKTKRVGR